MTRLTVWHEDGPENVLLKTADAGEIKACLNGVGVTFERVQLKDGVTFASSQDEVLAAYEGEVSRWKEAGGYQAADVLRLKGSGPETPAMRQKFLSEHRHTEDEVRLFLEGFGAFYLRLDGKVHQVVCEAGDLMSVPAGTRHWFDMSPDPYFMAVRLFTTQEGWVPDYTGDSIADRFPKLEALVAA